MDLSRRAHHERSGSSKLGLAGALGVKGAVLAAPGLGGCNRSKGAVNLLGDDGHIHIRGKALGLFLIFHDQPKA